MSNTRTIAHLLGQNHTATRFVDSADVDDIVLNSEYFQPNFRNLIINGQMDVAQRQTSVAVTSAANDKACDRFEIAAQSDATITASQDTDVPTGQGHTKSTKLVVTVADTSLSASQLNLFQQMIEGTVSRHLNWGYSNALDMTFSFWIKSSLTGSFTAYCLDGTADSQSIVVPFTIDSANTWEKKILSIPGPTTGGTTDFPIDTSRAMYLGICLGVGSNHQTSTINSWHSNVSGFKASRSSDVKFVGTASANMYITGVQFEVGNKATLFEHKSFQDHEWDCQRYYHSVKEGSGTYMIFATGRAWGSGGANGPYKFPRVMRKSPTMTAGGAASDYDFSLSGVPGAGSVSLNNDMMVINVTGSFTTGQIIVIGSNADGSGPAELKFDAEL